MVLLSDKAYFLSFSSTYTNEKVNLTFKPTWKALISQIYVQVCQIILLISISRRCQCYFSIIEINILRFLNCFLYTKNIYCGGRSKRQAQWEWCQVSIKVNKHKISQNGGIKVLKQKGIWCPRRARELWRMGSEQMGWVQVKPGLCFCLVPQRESPQTRWVRNKKWA